MTRERERERERERGGGRRRQTNRMVNLLLPILCIVGGPDDGDMYR